MVQKNRSVWRVWKVGEARNGKVSTLADAATRVKRIRALSFLWVSEWPRGHHIGMLSSNCGLSNKDM